MGTATMTMDTKILLAKQKSMLLEQLAALACAERPDDKLASYRDQANAILREFMLADRALATIVIMGANEFADIERPIDAIISYFDKSCAPAIEEDLIQGVLNGGFRSSDPKARLILVKSIGNHLSGTGAKSQLIKTVNGRIGKYNWPDSRFYLQ
jgi:hypothetical protein